MPGNVFPQLSNAPIPAFFSTAHRAITVRPNSWYLRATALSSSTIRDSDQYLQPNDTNPNRRGHPRDNTSTSTDTATIETGPPSSSTLWKAWKQQEHANKAARTHRPRRKRSTSSSSSSSSSSLESDTNSSSLHNELVKQVVDYSTKGWFVWFIRLGLVHLCLPFINGVMLGFGEICANEVTIRTGWLGLRALTDNYLHR
ncbi:hypothetical protein BDF22DRAFT_652699 [Syncephalis plumigaleata]|nr:hypothetical protein BDF22DRAFT_652699 [Syncephalis plumigaleata]